MVKYVLHIPVCILFLCILLTYAVTNQSRHCNVIISVDFDNCTNRAAELAEYANDEKNRVFPINSTQQKSSREDCVYEGICRKIFKVARIRRQSFSAKTLVHISDMLYRCCGRCAKYVLEDIFTQLSHLNLSIIESSDIVYPVLGKYSVDKLYGFHYIPVLQVPSAYYFTLAKSKREIAINMVTGCLKMWPLLLISLFFSMIAGFLVWITEAPFDNKDFSKDFFLGLYEGFWWSFISMTTVGYGDKVPKSPLGRMFSIIWILVGITICSIFVASLTAEVVNSRSPVNPKLSGKLVGVLKHRLNDATMVAEHGGILHAIYFNDTAIGVMELIKMLQRKFINGFLIDRSTYYYFSRVIKEEDKYKYIATSIRDINMVRTEKFFQGDQMVTGILVKNLDDYEYFKRYFEGNWYQIQTCYSYNLNYKDKKFEVKSYSTVEGLFFPFLYWSLGILGVIFGLGLMYEIRKHIIK